MRALNIGRMRRKQGTTISVGILLFALVLFFWIELSAVHLDDLGSVASAPKEMREAKVYKEDDNSNMKEEAKIQNVVTEMVTPQEEDDDKDYSGETGMYSSRGKDENQRSDDNHDDETLEDENDDSQPEFPIPKVSFDELNQAERPIVLDIYFYDLEDPFFSLIESGLTRVETEALKREVVNIWTKATKGRLQIRMHTRKFVLDRDRATAYLFYIIGHPKVASTRPEIQSWIVKPFAREIEQLLPILDELSSDVRIMRALDLAFVTSERMDRASFDKLVPKSLRNAFNGIKMDEEFISQSAWREFADVKDKRLQVRKINLAFRLFYLAAKLPSERLFKFASIMKERPMLFMHYAVGRDADVESHQVRRSKWDWENTLSIYPVPYYHALNGRGSQNWLDVIFRTASCWEPQNRRLILPGNLDFGPLECRWGVRKWEKHRYTTSELGRMVAHEVGHCIGLGHVQPHCVVYPRAEDGNLMQQQRNIGLEEWRDTSKCGCLSTSGGCGECRCTMDDENFARVGEARYLDDKQIDTALYYVRKRDYIESAPTEGFVTVGPSMGYITTKESGAFVRGGDQLTIRLPATTTGVNKVWQIDKLRMKLNSARRGVVSIKIYSVDSASTSSCSEVVNTKSKVLKKEVSFESMNLPAHQEWTILKNQELTLNPSQVLLLEFSQDVRIHMTTELTENKLLTCLQSGLSRSNQPLSGTLLVNLDMKAFGKD